MRSSAAVFAPFLLAVELFDPAAAFAPVEEWTAAFGTATRRLADGHFEAARDALRLALTLATEVGPRSPEMARTLDLLGSVHLQLGDTAEAERSYTRALEIQEAASDADALACVRLMNNLCRLYLQSARYAQAERLSRRALAIAPAAGAGRELDLERARSLTYLLKSDSLPSRRYAAGVTMCRQAIELFDASLGPEHSETALAWNDLGTLESLTGSHEAAISHLQHALQVLERTAGGSHQHTVTALMNLGWAYCRAGRPKVAEPVLRRAVALAETSFGAAHFQTAYALFNYADTLRRLGRKAEARKARKRSDEILARYGTAAAAVVDLNTLRREFR